MHDSHIHLSLEPLKSNLNEIINDFISIGGKYILNQSTNITDVKDTLNISNQFPNIIHTALGLHPTSFEESTIMENNFDDIYEKGIKNISIFERIIKENKATLSGIGETGLDYSKIKSSPQINKDVKEEIKELQKISFRKHIQLAKELDLGLSIHSRDLNGEDECIKDVIRIIAEEGRGAVRGSFHSYTGNIAFLQDILDLGFNIGFNAIITYKSGENVRETLNKIPVENILFETDGPFLPPQSVRKNGKIREKFAQPKDIKEIMDIAAEIKNITFSELEKITDRNFEQTFLKNQY